MKLRSWRAVSIATTVLAFAVGSAVTAHAGVGNYVTPSSGTVTTSSGTINLTPPAGFGCSANAGDATNPTQASTYFAAASVATASINFNWGSTAPTTAPFLFYVRDSAGSIATTGILPQGTSAPFPVAVPTLRLRDFAGNPAITAGSYKIGVACYNANTGAIDGTNFAESPLYVSNVTGTGFSWVFGAPASAPTLGTVVNGDTVASVAFSVPSATPALTSYSLSVNGSSRPLSPTEISQGIISLTGLANGSTNPVTLTVSNGVGPAATSNSVVVQPVQFVPPVTGTVYLAPTLTAIAGLRSVVLSWSAPTDHGRTGYTINASPSVPGAPFTAAAGATTLTVNGLTPGTPYSFTIVATYPSPDSGTTSGAATATPLPPVFNALTPTRVFETRPGEPAGAVEVARQRYGGVGNILKVKVTGVGGVPETGVGAVSLNVTAILPDGSGYVTVFPCGDRPLASNLNYVKDQIVPNAVIAPVSAAGEVCFYSLANTFLVADVSGWFAA